MESAPTEVTMANTPTLRFGEFDGEWSEKRYGDIYSFYTTNSYSRDNLNYEKGTVRNIHYGDIHTKFSTMFHLENEKVPFINEDIELNKIKDESYCQVGDLVIADASEDYADIGKTMEIMSLNNEKTLSGLHTFLARPNKYDMALGYTGYLLQSWKIRKQVMRIAQGTKVLSLSTKRLADVVLHIPTKPEQQKIAIFLSAIDSSIEQLSKKEQLLRSYKKGVMQKIFSREIRFTRDDGGAFEDWVEKRLGDIFKISAGGDIDKDNVSSEKDSIFKYPIFSNSDKNAGLYGYSNTAKIEENCLTVSGRGTLGIAIERKESFFPIVRLLVLVGKEKVNYKFFENAINSLNFFVESTGVPQLTAPQISIYKVTYPSLPEQTKIANFLSSLDKQIAQVSEQLAEKKDFKKGLLQKMFV